MGHGYLTEHSFCTYSVYVSVHGMPLAVGTLTPLQALPARERRPGAAALRQRHADDRWVLLDPV